MDISCDSVSRSDNSDKLDSCDTLLQQLNNNLTAQEITGWESADGCDKVNVLTDDSYR